MPDIFDLNAMRHLTLENDMARVKEGSSPLEEARQKTLAADMGRVKEMREPWEGLREKYGFDLSPEEYTRFGMYMDHGMLKEDDLVKIVTARAISQGLGRMGIEVPESNVYQNLEAYKTSILGKSILGDNEAPRTPIGDLDAIARSLKNGFITLDNGRLGIERAIAMGQKDKEVLRAIEERIRVNNEKAARNTDFQKRNIFTTIGKATAEMLPYSLATVAAGLGGWPIGIAGSFLVSGGVAAGNVFNTLIDDINADYEPALGISIGVGAVIGIAESLFGEAASLLSEITGAKTVIKSFSRSAAKAAADRVGSRVGKAAVNRLAPFAGALAMETLMNGAEEFVEEWASIGAEELAYQLSENGVKPGRDYLNRSIQAFKGGMLGSIFLSAPGAWGSANATVKNIKALKTAAEAAESFKEFEELSKENPYYKDLSSKEKEEVYSKARQKREMEEKALVERNRKEKPAASPEPVEAAPREARRKEGGSLHYKTRAVDIADNGTVSSVMTVGDPQSGNRYGQIDYRLNENELVIDRVNFASWLTDKEEVIHDALIELAAENKQAGNIVWNTENAIEMDIRDRVIKENPFGNSLQWFDPDMDAGETKTAAAVASKIREAFHLKEEETRLAAHVVYRTSRALGFNPEDVIGKGLEIYGAEELKENPELGEIVGRHGDPRARGGTFFVRDGEIQGFPTVRREFERGIKGVIYAMENADLSTFVHEWLHFIDAAYIGRNGKLRGLFEEAIGKPWDDFSTADREHLAESFEEYLKTGKTPIHKLRNLFQRLANALASLVKGRGVTLSPSLRKAFNALFQDPESAVSRAVAEAAEGKTRTAEEGSIAAQTEEAPGKGTVLQQERADLAEVRRRYEGTDLWMKAPGGEATNLTEKQWLEVRTEGFKKWFGDWESAILIKMAEQVWGGDKTATRFNFLPSEKLKTSIRKLTGQDLQQIFITDSDIRHIKNRHGENQALQGQPDIKPEDVSLIPFVLNEFDAIEQEIEDKMGNKRLLYIKQINGTAYTASIERGKNKEQIVSFWQNRVPRAANPDALGLTSETTPVFDTIQKAEDLRNSKNNASQAVGQNGEPEVRTGAEGKGVFVNTITGEERSAPGGAGEEAGNILFQLADEEIDAEARGFNNWWEWAEFAEVMDPGGLAAETEGMTEEAKDAWYKNRWEKAKGIVRDEKGAIQKQARALESGDIDNLVIDKLRNEEGALEKFLEELYYSSFSTFDSALTEEDAVLREELGNLAYKIQRQVHPTVLLNAQSVAKRKKLKGPIRKSILTLMEEGARWYRGLYSDIMGDADSELKALEENEIVTAPPIQEEEAENRSIAELSKIANKIKDKETKAKLLSGELKPGADVVGLIKRVDEDNAALRKELREKEGELRDDVSKLSYADRKIHEKEKQIKGLEKEIAEREEWIEKLERNVRRLEGKRALDKAMSERQRRDEKRDWELKQKLRDEKKKERFQEKLAEEKAKGKVSVTERKGRLALAREERGKAIESFRARIQNEYETLARDKQELKALRKETEKELTAVNKTAGKDAARDAALQKSLAVDGLKAKIKMNEAEKREIEKIRDIKRRIFRHIMKGREKGGMKHIWFEDAEKIRAIQDMVNPKVKNTIIKWEGEKYTVGELRDKAVDVIDVLPKSIINRILKKSFDDWTINELEEFAAEIDRLRYEGRKKWEIIKNQRRMENENAIVELRGRIYNHPDYVKEAAVGSKEWKKQKTKQIKQNVMGFLGNTYHFDRITDWLDGGEEREYTALLVDEQRRHYREKENKVDGRYEWILNKIKELGIDVRKLYEKEHTIKGIGPENSDVVFTTAQLMGLSILLRNEKTRAHITFGNLWSSEERLFYKGDWGTTIAAGERKFNLLTGYINKNLTDDEKILAQAIADDFKGENFRRFADVVATEFNRRLGNESNYLPGLVMDVTGSDVHEEQQAGQWLDIGGASVQRNVDKGMSVNRIPISPWYQRAIELDILKLHEIGVERQEHFIAFGHYIRKLNAVFRGKSALSNNLQNRIIQTFGKQTMDRIKQEINVYANPRTFREGSDKIIRALRGNLGFAYLAGKTSNILQQLVTSPAPFFQEVNPLEMFASSWKYLTSPKAFMENVKHLSTDMRHFSGDALFDLIHEAAEDSKLKRGVKKFQEIGMKGLEWANAVPVFIGWNAVYEKYLRGGMTTEEAAAKADAFTRKTSPSGRPEDNSPVFRDSKESMKILTQFGAGLNAIWNQIAYDLPMAIKRRQFKKALGIIGSYAVTGALAMMIKNGFDDDDDDKKKAKRMIAWSFTQFSDSVPLIGDLITSQVEALITGEKPRYFQSETLPAVENIIKGVGYMTRGEWARGAGEFAEGVELSIGSPSSGRKELQRILGIGDGDGKIEFNPEAFLGRRK